MILIINKDNRVIRAIHTNKALSDDDVKALHFCSEIDFSESKIKRDVDANIGDTYDEATGNVIAQTVNIRKTVLTKLELYKRLTLAEKLLLNNPRRLEKGEQAEAMLEIIANEIQLAEFIDLDDAETVRSLKGLVSLGVLTNDRVKKIRGLEE